MLYNAFFSYFTNDYWFTTKPDIIIRFEFKSRTGLFSSALKCGDEKLPFIESPSFSFSKSPEVNGNLKILRQSKQCLDGVESSGGRDVSESFADYIQFVYAEIS